ncbi:MAG: hypothetical protein FJ288_19550 [Planctomycetes bacterium]|nr:hypothetical protein [Planctomycetota bacterium]
MVEARSREAWAHTSAVLALVANVNRDPKKHGPFKPSDFDPHKRNEKDLVIPRCDIEVLKQVFIDGKGGSP